MSTRTKITITVVSNLDLGINRPVALPPYDTHTFYGGCIPEEGGKLLLYSIRETGIKLPFDFLCCGNVTETLSLNCLFILGKNINIT